MAMSTARRAAAGGCKKGPRTKGRRERTDGAWVKEKLKSRYQELEASSRLYAATQYEGAACHLCED